VSGFCAACLVPYLSKQCLAAVDKREERESQKSIEDANMIEFGNKEGLGKEEMAGKDGDKMLQDNSSPEKQFDIIPLATENTNLFVRMFNTSKEYIVKEMTQESDFHVKAGTDSTVTAIHDNGTKHDSRTEEMFKYIQVILSFCYICSFLLFVWLFFFTYVLLAVVYVSYVEDKFFNIPRL
jgi:hypothetical protein